MAVERWAEAELRLLQAYRILFATRGPNANITRRVAEDLVELYEATAGELVSRDRKQAIEKWRRAAEGTPPPARHKALSRPIARPTSVDSQPTAASEA